MAGLSVSDQVVLSRITGNMMSLLRLDDTWTEAVQRVAPDAIPPVELVDEMGRRLEEMSEAADFFRRLAEDDDMEIDLTTRFDTLMWGEGLSIADRDDLRWLVQREAGPTGLVWNAAERLSGYQHEQSLLAMQLERFRRGRQSRATSAGIIAAVWGRVS